MTKCFLVEPVYDVPGSLPVEAAHRDPQRRAILNWRRPDTGEVKEFPHMFGPGAMYFLTYLLSNFTWSNEDGPHLQVETPGGGWDIDSRCNNCGLPDDTTHRCWIRHGTPPNITVDKSGVTCNAGGGSIKQKTYHGFLRNGELTDSQ